ncbi:uracil-DNA glycosylase family protein [Legionella spiritensis]|uniref:Uracil DNA glycosylase n=1 Tax=Legionella spiritensis TaxID=452 RepID=A0A0W0Z6K0_LEGSP|nr:uracil-DNA glycosylase [Legionella spiritensis]KTD64768.1 uracil DNA glycosylase [Legionella spiritensis]SNV39742.1 uracil-DNA glycosylase [Legionella spiritensis]
MQARRIKGLLVQELLEKTHPQWHDVLEKALNSMDEQYVIQLKGDRNWLPGWELMLAAFSQPLLHTRYLLLGESPYPRRQSANGYAFWDNAVASLWSDKGLSKEVNRATSLRNMMKMLLVARGDLGEDHSQAAIARLDKSHYWRTASELFHGMIRKGFILLNASLVYSDNRVPYHARQWQPFISSLFNQLALRDHKVTLLLFGKIAARVQNSNRFPCLIAEHPYNLSFISNKDVLAFFKPLDLLSCHE